MSTLSIALVLVTMFAGSCRGFGSGAPSSACLTMRPGHSKDPQDSKVNPSPYVIAIEGNATTYKPVEKLSVEVRSVLPDVKVRGFILEARTVSSVPSGPIGTFSDTHRVSRAICRKGALTHRTYRSRPAFSTTWTPPKEQLGDIYFVATVVKDFRTFWMDIRSHILTPFVPTPPPTTTPQPKLLPLNVTDACAQTVLALLPVERPHVAILCDAHAQCPCGWLCCPPCVDEVCAGYAICRQPPEE